MADKKKLGDYVVLEPTKEHEKEISFDRGDMSDEDWGRLVKQATGVGQKMGRPAKLYRDEKVIAEGEEASSHVDTESKLGKEAATSKSDGIEKVASGDEAKRMVAEQDAKKAKRAEDFKKAQDEGFTEIDYSQPGVTTFTKPTPEAEAEAAKADAEAAGIEKVAQGQAAREAEVGNGNTLGNDIREMGLGAVDAMDKASPYVEKAGGFLKTVGEGVKSVVDAAANPAVAVQKGVEGLGEMALDGAKYYAGEVAGNEPMSKRPDMAAIEGLGAQMGAMAPKKGAGGAASVDMRIPGSGGAPKTYAEKDFGPEIAAGEVEKIRAQADVAREKADTSFALAQAHREMGRIMKEQAADTIANEQVFQDSLKQYDDHLKDLQAEQARFDPTIDPNRYWKNKDAGQIALGAIAGALMGFAGKGMDYLNMIQREVDRDVQAQQATFENADKKMQRQMAAAKDTYARARMAGLGIKEAKALAASQKLDALAKGVEATAQEGLGNVEMANATALSAGMRAASARAQQEGATSANERAARKQAADAAERSSRAAMMQAGAATLRAQAAGKGGGKTPAAIQSKIADTRELISTLKQMRDYAKGGNIKKGARAVVNAVGVAPTEGSAKVLTGRNEYELGKVKVARHIANSVLNKHEQDAIFPNIPNPDRPLGPDADKFFNDAIELSEQRIRDLESGQGATENEPIDVGAEE